MAEARWRPRPSPRSPRVGADVGRRARKPPRPQRRAARGPPRSPRAERAGGLGRTPAGHFRGLPLYGDHALEPTLALLGPEITLRPLPVGPGDGRWAPGWLEPDGSVGYPGDVMPGEGAGAAHAYIQRAGPWYRAENRLRFWRNGDAGPVRAEFSYASWPPRRASSFGAPHAGGLSAEEAAELEALAASLRLAVRPAAP